MHIIVMKTNLCCMFFVKKTLKNDACASTRRQKKFRGGERKLLGREALCLWARQEVTSIQVDGLT